MIFLNCDITMNETWERFYDSERKQRLMETERRHRGSRKPKKFFGQKSTAKVLSSVFWNCPEVIMTSFLDNSRTITGSYYLTKKIVGRRREK